MLPKKNRLDKKAVQRVFKEGKFLNSSSLTFKFILNKASASSRISVIVPKSVSKLANKRNHLRRKTYFVLKNYLKEIPPVLGALIFRKYQDDTQTISNEIKNILSKIN